MKEYPNKNTKVYLADTFGESGTLIASAADYIRRNPKARGRA